ncbi:Hypothetical protein, putative [Bodo saltans]|uniref:Uncharacterized protein n=1 Tax=Bodo saltans TaxID=75058 RepID=A0A0S4JRU2_BODSA|nr:Hypothetical protein, putative [Bodo saltans]|eukprot:CUG94262.1 Hypothetical protein, putative [Bodo saltans]
MVLHKWAAVTRSPAARKGLRPIVDAISENPKLAPADYKIPYIIRPFIKDLHINSVQHLENRGMYKEELSIERSRFPRTLKTLVVQTDGSLNEREFECVVPPLLISYQDRPSAHRQRQLALMKIGKLRREGNTAQEATEPSEMPMCNALTFPYCVPKNMIRRSPVRDPLLAKKHSD